MMKTVIHSLKIVAVSVSALFLAAAMATAAGSVEDSTYRNGSLVIVAKSSCCHGLMRLEITQAVGGAFTLRTLRLDSPDNVKIWSLSPYPPANVSRVVAEIRVINRGMVASATVVIRDSLGTQTEIPFSFFPRSVAFDPPFMEFGEVPVGGTIRDTVRVMNMRSVPFDVETAHLVRGREGLRLIVPVVPTTLPAQFGSIVAVVEFTRSSSSALQDSLVLLTCDLCDSFLLPIHVPELHPGSVESECHDELEFTLTSAYPISPPELLQIDKEIAYARRYRDRFTGQEASQRARMSPVTHCRVP